MLIGDKKCPTCGVTGKVWKRQPEVLVCGLCNSYFAEFGIVVESQIGQEDEDQMT